MTELVRTTKPASLTKAERKKLAAGKSSYSDAALQQCDVLTTSIRQLIDENIDLKCHILALERQLVKAGITPTEY